ncbi:MAG TPA: MFS transporter [Thermoanaerobaculia bacterium]|nr:MFS transporter [Thermoanaerobaculia bacterium]
MTADRASLGRLWALMLTAALDMVGFLIVLPLLPFYATRLGASPLAVTLMISSFAVAQLATAPTWGRLSDRIGRRPILVLGVAISGASHLLFALACSEWAMARISPTLLVGLLFLSRFVQGAGGATTGVVQAYVGDAIVPEERAKALGWITAAISAGVVLGPTLGSIAAVAGPAAPGLAAAALCLVNLLFVRGWLPESSSPEARAAAAGADRRPLAQRMLEVVSHPRRPVERLIWIYAAGMMAFMAINAVLALYLQARFGMTEKTIGYVYAFIGTVSLVMRSIVLGPAVRRFGERGVLRLGLLALGTGYALQPMAPTLWAFGAAIVLVPVGTALLFPATTSLVSRYAERHEIGATMGVQQAFGGSARLFGPMWAGLAFQEVGPGAPFWIASGLALGTLLFAAGLEAPPRPSTLATVPTPAGEAPAGRAG